LSQSSIDIAHVQGESGTFVVPSRSPYDRQMLREHVETLAGRAPTLRLGLHGTLWTITRPLPDARCTACTQLLARLSCTRAHEVAATCIDCAIQPGSNERMEWQHG
jgi:hypothetical protein